MSSADAAGLESGIEQAATEAGLLLPGSATDSRVAFPPSGCEEAVDVLKSGDEIDIDFSAGTIRSGSREFKFFPLPESVIGIVQAGGLIEYTKKKLGR